MEIKIKKNDGKKRDAIFFFFFSIPSLHGMLDTDYYENQKFIPSLYTYQYTIPQATQITEVPFINTFGANENFFSFFSIELLKYKLINGNVDFGQKDTGVKYDPGIENAILKNREMIVIAQNQYIEKKLFPTIFIPAISASAKN